MSDADKWPKSFRWPGKYLGHDDIVTFLNDDDTDRDLQGVEWTYRECVDEPAGDVAYWEPTDQHRQKSPPAPSQDGRIQELLDEVRMYAKQADVRCSQESKNLRLIRCIEKLADAVERLAK